MISHAECAAYTFSIGTAPRSGGSMWFILAWLRREVSGRGFDRTGPKKQGLWTHCSVFEVRENITPTEVRELEVIFRHIYRRDSRAARLNMQRSFGRMKKLEHILPRKRVKNRRQRSRRTNGLKRIFGPARFAPWPCPFSLER